MILNKEQLECSQKLKDFINGEKNGFFLIDGAGGTGKTTVVTSIMDNPYSFLFLGATNKVCKNILDSLEKNGIDNTFNEVKVETIARFLSWKKTKDHNDNDIITMNLPELNFIRKIIVIDEVSMLNKEQVDWIIKLKNIRKVILIGDKMQIPPIEKDNENIYRENGFLVSSIFKHVDFKYTLTIQNRQSTKSNLYRMINEFRQNMDYHITFKDIANQYVNNEDVMIMNLYSRDFQDFIKDNKVVSVCHKNRTVQSHLWVINNFYNPKEIKEGDVLYFQDYYKNNDVIFYASDTCTVLEIESTSKEVTIFNYGLKNIPFKRLKVKDIFDDVFIIDIAESHKLTIRPMYDIIQRLARKETSFENKATLYTFYQDYQTSFASLNKPYAITCHKAQGSTYDNVVIPIYDFISNRNHRDNNQLFYVAMSRAKKKIIFVNTKVNFNNTSNRVNFTQEERHMIALKTNFHCSTITGHKKDGTPVYCDHYFENVSEFDVDHIKPLKDGGDNSVGNLQILCKECHKKKHYERSI
jgi:exodeoxyribonuclease-5